MYTVRSSRPVNAPRRAKCFTAGLLIAVLAAAYVASRGANASPTLRSIVEVPGWRIAFAPPAGWDDDGETLGPLGGRFHIYRSADGTRQVAFGRIPASSDQSIEEVCTKIIGEARELEMAGGMRGVHVREVPLGDWIGLEHEWVPEIMGRMFGHHVYLLGAKAPAGGSAESGSDVYVIELRTPPPLHLKDETLWNTIVSAVETRSP